MIRVGYSAQLVTEGRSFGVSNVVRELAVALSRSTGADELRVFVPRPLPGVDARSQVLTPRSTRSRIGRVIWEQCALPSVADRQSIDVFHAPGYVLPVRMRRPSVVTIHDLLALTHPRFCKPANRCHYRLALPLSARLARRVVVVSDAVGRQVVERLGVSPDRVVVVRPGVASAFRREPPAAELRALRARHGLGRPFALFIGCEEPKKNLGRLVRAFALARERRAVDGELVLAGGTGWGADAGVGAGLPWLRRLGHVPANELPALLRCARLLVFPSLAEGFGLPTVEAMASGLPVVASPVPAVMESDPEAAVRVDPNDVEAIAAGIEAGWCDGDLRRRSVAHGRRAVADLTWERAASCHWALYREIAAE